MWRKGKNKFDYHVDFDESAEYDLRDMVYRDRNHPSVFMWSIGNEIREQFDTSGIRLAKKLAAIIKSLDNTRPVTSALTENDPAKNYIYQSGALDVLGFNYKINDYPMLRLKYPGQKLIATETASALETRGVYHLPSDSLRSLNVNKQPDAQALAISAYDNTVAYWGNTHEKAWVAVKNNPFIAGCFVWSGFDYIGEPFPNAWPARSSYYGIIDLAGIPKDVYYMYQSEWTNKPVLHIFPHWNWKKGQIVDIWAYYNMADEVELFLNNKSLGIRRKSDTVLHAMWRVPFEAGVLKAISRKDGKVVLTKEISTAGEAAAISLQSDHPAKALKDKELLFVRADIRDRNGNIVPEAENHITFSISNNAIIRGTDNGFQADTSGLTRPVRDAWKGSAIVIIQPHVKKGNITLRATSPGLHDAILHISLAQ